MTKTFLQKAKDAILFDIRKCPPNTRHLEIKVEAHGGIEYFYEALQLPEVQSALRRKNITATIRVIDPLKIVRRHILRHIKDVPQGTTITYQALQQDADLYYDAVALPEVKLEIERKNIEIEIQVLDKHGRVKPNIVIATYDDIANGRIDDLL